MIAAGVDALQVSLPSFAHTHVHTKNAGKKKKNTVACSLLRVEAQHFHSKKRRDGERETGVRERNEEEEEGGERNERKEGRGEKKTSRSTQKMLTFGSPQLSPPVKIGGVRFRGLLLCVTRQRKRGGKKKKCH